jgi:hypothetical protein
LRTRQIKLEGEPQEVAWLARALRERFKVTEESGDHPLHGDKAHLVRRWLTVVVVDDDGVITPTPE